MCFKSTLFGPVFWESFDRLKEYVGDAVNDHFPAMVKNDTVGGRLVAMPWFTDASGALPQGLAAEMCAQVPETWER
jgi:trehalose/maltose transport system substrate-binding protein